MFHILAVAVAVSLAAITYFAFRKKESPVAVVEQAEQDVAPEVVKAEDVVETDAKQVEAVVVADVAKVETVL